MWLQLKWVTRVEPWWGRADAPSREGRREHTSHRDRGKAVACRLTRGLKGTLSLPTPPPGTSTLVNYDKVNLCGLQHCLGYAGITSPGAWYTWLSLLWPPLNSITKCTSETKTLQPGAQSKKGSNNPVWKEKLESHGHRGSTCQQAGLWSCVDSDQWCDLKYKENWFYL